MERRWNPFVRAVENEGLRQRIGCRGNPEKALAVLRMAKDRGYESLDDNVIRELLAAVDAEAS